MEKKWTIQSALRLDQFLRQNIPLCFEEQVSVSNSKVRRLIMAGCVSINGVQNRNPSFIMKKGDRLTVLLDKEKFFFEKQPDDIKYELTEKDVLYEDDVIIVVNKPAFFPVEKTIAGDRDNLHEAVKRYLWKKNPQLRNVPYAGVMHRLDRETSGVILFTKSRSVNAKIFELFEKHKAQKVYNAVCCKEGGKYAARKVPESFIIEKNITRISPSSQACKMGVTDKTPGTKGSGSSKNEIFTAKTEFSVLKENGKYCLMEAKPFTGRTHQIRVHLASEGLPLLGDTLYGGKKSQRIMLHALSLTFPHPVTDEILCIEASLPDIFTSFFQ